MKNSLNEIIQLSDKERKEVDNAVKVMVDAIKNDIVVKNGDKYVTTINYKMASGEPAKAKIYYSDKEQGVEGKYFAVDPNNLEDNVIKLYKGFFAKYFGTKAKLTGTESKGEDQLRRVITHELIHAKDPALNHRGKKQQPQQQGVKQTPQGKIDWKEYFNKPEELLAFTSQLNDHIVRMVKQYIEKYIKNDEVVTKMKGVGVPLVQQTDKILASKAEEIQQTLKQLDDLYSKGTAAKTMTPLTKLFIQQINDQGIFKNLANTVYKFLEKTGLSKKNPDAKEGYILPMKMIKKYNPTGYEKFTKRIRTSLKKLELSINVELYKRAAKQVKKGSRGVKLVQISIDGQNSPTVTPANATTLKTVADNLKIKGEQLYPKKAVTEIVLKRLKQKFL